MAHSLLKLILLAVFLFGLPELAEAKVRFPPKPSGDSFISDVASLLSADSASELEVRLTEVLKERAIPIIVVGIGSQHDYGAGSMSIETYARILYVEWGIGHQRVTVRGAGVGRSEDIDWNKGILLLVAVDDRKARIELGAGFGRAKDSLCASIMSEHIIPFFKAGDYEGGILAGTRALAQMALGEAITAPPRPWWHYGLMICLPILAVFTFVSLIRRGSSGWAWLFWAAVFSILGSLLYAILTSSDNNDGFGGGSFGGGFSGGGGATGSW